MAHIKIKGKITKSQAINIVTEYAEKQISQVKDWQSNYPFMPLTKDEEKELIKAEKAIRIVKDLKLNKSDLIE
tara:strand:- start:2089 stop:2307 length:219 start_codon:yes stop_codon:yes gene_type:complete